MAVLVCCVSVGSRKVRLGKFGQGGLGRAGQHGQVPIGLGLAWRGWAVLERKDTASCGEAWQGGLGAVRSGTVVSGELRRGLARRFRRGMAWDSCHGQVGRVRAGPVKAVMAL